MQRKHVVFWVHSCSLFALVLSMHFVLGRLSFHFPTLHFFYILLGCFFLGTSFTDMARRVKFPLVPVHLPCHCTLWPSFNHYWNAYLNIFVVLILAFLRKRGNGSLHFPLIFHTPLLSFTYPASTKARNMGWCRGRGYFMCFNVHIFMPCSSPLCRSRQHSFLN